MYRVYIGLGNPYYQVEVTFGINSKQKNRFEFAFSVSRFISL